MRKLVTAMAVAAWTLSPLAAHAQDANPHNGTWRAAFESNSGAAREGTVVIKDQGGTWDMLMQARNNPCVGRAYPVAVQKATADELVFEIQRSKALAGCKDGSATLRRAADGSLEGEFDEGRKIRLTREK